MDQLASLVRNGAIPKADNWVMTILDWFVVHGLFAVRKASHKSPFHAVRYNCYGVFSMFSLSSRHVDL
jgi:DNA polymerase phi